MAKEIYRNLFGQRRLALELSLFDMAVRIGDVTPSTLRFWERDQVLPPLSRVPGIARGYEMTESEVEAEILAMSRRVRQAAAASH